MFKKIAFGTFIFFYLMILGFGLVYFFWKWFAVEHLGFREISFSEVWAIGLFMSLFNWKDEKLENIRFDVFKNLMITEEQKKNYDELVWHEYKKFYFKTPIRYSVKAFFLLLFGYILSHFFM